MDINKRVFMESILVVIVLSIIIFFIMDQMAGEDVSIIIPFMLTFVILVLPLAGIYYVLRAGDGEESDNNYSQSNDMSPLLKQENTPELNVPEFSSN